MTVSDSVAAAAFRDAVELLWRLAVPEPAAPPPLRLELAAPPPAVAAPPAPVPRGESGPMPATLSELPTLVEAAAALRAGTLTARALAERSLEAAERTAGLGALVAVDADGALRQADALDAEARAGRRRGPLHGIPITVKDVIDVAGLPTRAGSAAYDDLPAVDADAVAILRDAGAVILGKAATHEFALGIATPQCGNPYDPTRLAGGSSGGSAVAVATGVGIVSLGTDTRASLRAPASLCGVVGFKPTLGRVPGRGVVPLSWTTDHVGPIARTVEDAAAVLAVLADDPTIAAAPNVAGLAVGVPPPLAGTDPAVAAAFERALATLAGIGCRLVELDRPDAADLEVANALGMLVTRSEAAAFHRSRGTDLALCIPEVRDQLAAAMGIAAIDYLEAQRQRGLLAARTLEAFARCDVIATPSTPIPAPPRDGYERYLLVLSRDLILWSLVGAPAVSLPSGVAPGGLPTGIQLAGRPGADATVAAVGIALERAL
jgi:aspartyl-tRNA(Asn)/glutamyl-tRNA(Gln) amidotransferase subunit A